MRFIYLQDTHIKGINSENRIGDYYQDIMAKMKEVTSLSKKLKVDYVVHGGDLYDSAKVSDIMVDDFMDMEEESGIRWYILPGNHDEIGHNWELSKGSSLAHIFRRSKLINKLTTLPDAKKFNYIIQGFEYFHNVEQEIKEKGLTCISSNAPFKIAIVHALVTLKSLPYECMHVVAKDIKTDFDLVLVAHNHHPWGIKEFNGTKFANIGCVGRRKIDEKDITPSILLVDTETKELKMIELKSAKKAEEVFDLKKVEESKLFEEDINNFIKSLSDVKVQSLDIRGIVEYLAGENNIDKEVKDCVIERIGGFENG